MILKSTVLTMRLFDARPCSAAPDWPARDPLGPQRFRPREGGRYPHRLPLAGSFAAVGHSDVSYLGRVISRVSLINLYLGVPITLRLKSTCIEHYEYECRLLVEVECGRVQYCCAYIRLPCRNPMNFPYRVHV